MFIDSFIEDHKIIDMIIRHLELTFEVDRFISTSSIRKELIILATHQEMALIYKDTCC